MPSIESGIKTKRFELGKIENKYEGNRWFDQIKGEDGAESLLTKGKCKKSSFPFFFFLKLGLNDCLRLSEETCNGGSDSLLNALVMSKKPGSIGIY